MGGECANHYTTQLIQSHGNSLPGEGGLEKKEKFNVGVSQSVEMSIEDRTTGIILLEGLRTESERGLYRCVAVECSIALFKGQ